jgi:hypothetical protein
MEITLRKYSQILERKPNETTDVTILSVLIVTSISRQAFQGEGQSFLEVNRLGYIAVERLLIFEVLGLCLVYILPYAVQEL